MVILGLACLLSAARPYRDTKDRFRLELAPGWELSPQFGDTAGMVFKKKLGRRRGVGLAFLAVRVAPEEMESARAFARSLEPALQAQPGFRSLGEARAQVGGRPALLRKYRASFDGYPGLKKRIDSYFLEAHGRVFLLQVTSGERERRRIERDVQAMLASFVPMGGRRPEPRRPRPRTQAVPSLAGRWVNDDGLVLFLAKDQTFTLADVGGRYEANGDALTLIIPKKGRQEFTYQLVSDRLTLRSPDLPGPVTYRRDDRGPKKHTAGDFVGSWETVGTAKPIPLELGKDGDFRMGEFEGTWQYEAGRLQLRRSKSEVITYDVRLAGGRLILSGADLDRPIAFRRR